MCAEIVLRGQFTHDRLPQSVGYSTWRMIERNSLRFQERGESQYMKSMFIRLIVIGERER